MSTTRAGIVILVSGRGSNMQAIIEAVRDGRLPAEIHAVVSNDPGAPALEHARAAGIPAIAINHREFPTRAQFDQALIREIDAREPRLVVLAGFMRILSAGFVARYHGRLVNIHPSLLPAYGGLNTHGRALQDGVRIHGCTVHFVTADLDHGPIIIQAAVPVLCHDTEQTLAARVLHEEHRIYPQAIHWLCADLVELRDDGRVRLRHHKQPGFALISPSLE